MVSIIVVTLRRARLAPVSVADIVFGCGRYRLVVADMVASRAGPGTQVNSAWAIPPWVGAVSTSESCGVNRHSAWYTSPYPWSRMLAGVWRSVAKYGKLFAIGKGQGQGLDTCYSATYLSQTRDQQRFTILEVAADWHEQMVPQRIMWPSIARANGQLDPRCS